MANDRDAFAAKVAAKLYARDTTAQRLGMTLDAVTMGAATLSMTVTEDMLNGHCRAHGGCIFTLADTAFAYACNGENVATLAQPCQITFIATGQPGERLTATATEISKTGRSGLYDVDVHGGDGRLIAAFRGASRTVGGLTDTVLGEAP